MGRQTSSRPSIRSDRGRRIGPGFATGGASCIPAPTSSCWTAAPEPGGYCRTVVQDGFRVDYSGHFFHFKQPAIEACCGRGCRARTSARFLRKKRHPLRGPRYRLSVSKPNIHQLRTKTPPRPGRAVLPAHRWRPPQSFGEMLIRRLGKGITDKFSGRTTRSSTPPTSIASTSTPWAGSSRAPTSPHHRPTCGRARGHGRTAATSHLHVSPPAAPCSTSTRCCTELPQQASRAASPPSRSTSPRTSSPRRAAASATAASCRRRRSLSSPGLRHRPRPVGVLVEQGAGVQPRL